MRIAITGKIASGKSYISHYLCDTYNFKIFSFAQPIKKICNDIFNMKGKDRLLLQEFSEKCKELDKDVWVKYLDEAISNETGNIVIDDMRFPNEWEMLTLHGFTIIKLTLPPELQLQRIKETYPDTYKKHLERLNHISESSYEYLPYDYTIDVSNGDVLNNINKILKFI
tara:strand:+ start:241 stop:747 length:507 start_codon:yes stop_codon:yes gene_type:complete